MTKIYESLLTNVKQYLSYHNKFIWILMNINSLIVELIVSGTTPLLYIATYSMVQYIDGLFQLP